MGAKLNIHHYLFGFFGLVSTVSFHFSPDPGVYYAVSPLSKVVLCLECVLV